MTMDYYAEAQDIARRLEIEGRAADAKKLDDAIANGSTGTEILMALRWNLQQIEKTRPLPTGDTLQRIRLLADAIGTALRQ